MNKRRRQTGEGTYCGGGFDLAEQTIWLQRRTQSTIQQQSIVARGSTAKTLPHGRTPDEWKRADGWGWGWNMDVVDVTGSHGRSREVTRGIGMCPDSSGYPPCVSLSCRMFCVV